MQANTAQALADDTDTRGCDEDWRNADVVCGGFPCQDLSHAGQRAGITGERSGLWAWLCGAVRMVRPKYAIVENVAGLLTGGMDTVLGDLAEGGYDTEWDCIPAFAVGAPHQRDRVWIVAYPESDGCRQGLERRSDPGVTGEQEQAFQVIANAPQVFGLTKLREQQDRALSSHWRQDWPEYIETLRGMDDGIPGRVDGLAALGNTLIPQIPEMLGRAIKARERI